MVKSQAIFKPDHDKNIIFTNNSTTITIKKTNMSEIHHANGVITSYKDLANRFPQTFKGSIMILWPSMVDYTLFGDIKDDLDVEIEFKHEGQYQDPQCVYWSQESQGWLDDGCNLKESNRCKTKCFCNHLTNFGLLFGGTARNEVHEFVKDMASKAICGLSVVLLIGAQIVLFNNKYEL